MEANACGGSFQTKSTSRIVNFTLPADNKVNIKENEKKKQIIKPYKRNKKKSCGPLGYRLYQLEFVWLERSPKARKED